MRRIVEDTSDSGLDSLLGETITLFCLNYIYTGKLVAINEKYVELEDPKIVYETGSFDTKEWSDAQALPHNLFVVLGCVESFGIVK